MVPFDTRVFNWEYTDASVRTYRDISRSWHLAHIFVAGQQYQLAGIPEKNAVTRLRMERKPDQLRGV